MSALPPPTAPTPLLPWLLAALPQTNRTRVKQFLKHGQVTVNGVAVTRHDHPLQPGDSVAVARVVGPDPAYVLDRAGIRVVYEDDALIAIDKPTGLLTVATDREKSDTAFARLASHLADRKAGRPFVVHRLDRDTSGLLLFARTPEARDKLQAAWDAVAKTYLAVVEGVPNPPAGVVENYLTEGKNLRVRAELVGDRSKWAVTRYRVVRQERRRSTVEVELETGRKHQIRVHLAGLGCPVIGDSVYGAKSDPVGRLGLHAWKLAFDHPVTGARVELESPLPDKLRRASCE